MSNLFNHIIKISIYLLVFLLPLFFLPFSFEAFEFNKQELLFFLVSIAFFAWLAKMVLVDKEIKFRRTPLDIPVLLFLFVAVLSAIFSVDRPSSIFGFYGRFSDGLIGLLSLGMLYFLITNNAGLRNEKLKTKSEKPQLKTKSEEEKTLEPPLLSVNGILKALMWSVFFVVLISYLSIFGVWEKINASFGEKIQLPPIMLQRIFNPAAGSMEGLSLFLAPILILLTTSILIGGKRRFGNIVSWFLLLAVLFLLLLIDFTPAWIVVLVSLVLFIGFSLWKRFFRENVNRLLLPIFIIVLAGMFLFIDASKFQFLISPAGNLQLPKEQVLSQGQSWTIAFKSAVENIKSGFLGSGIGTFHYDFAKFKSAEFNQSPLWQVRFDRPGSNIAEILGTMGFLGIISYFLLVGLFLMMSWMFLNLKLKAQNEKPQPKTQNGNLPSTNYPLPLLMAFMALFIAQLVYYQNTVLAFFFWLILALSVVSWKSPNDTKTFSFKDFPELSLVFSVILIILGLSFLTGYFFAGRFYLADVNYKNAVMTGEIEKLEKAASLNPYQPHYKLVLSRAYLSRILAETQKSETQRDPVALSENAYLAITYAKNGQIGRIQVKGATEQSPNRVAAWETLGMVYRDIQGVAAGSLEWGIKAFEKAVVLEPTNPVLHTELGKLYLTSGDIERAKTEFSKAKELKPDYLDSSFQMVLAYEREGNSEEAISQMESLVASEPLNTEVLFQLGRLYFNSNRTDEAISQFERIISLMPNHSNAHYSLGVAYQRKGETAKAIAEFEKVLELNPGNQNVQARLDALKQK